jgi:hypothetical protein
MQEHLRLVHKLEPKGPKHQRAGRQWLFDRAVFRDIDPHQLPLLELRPTAGLSVEQNTQVQGRRTAARIHKAKRALGYDDELDAKEGISVSLGTAHNDVSEGTRYQKRPGGSKWRAKRPPKEAPYRYGSES